MDIKKWIIEVGLKKMGPSAIRAMLAAFTGLVLAHHQILDPLGIGYDQATDTLYWHLSTAKEWMGTIGLGLITALIMGVQHHGAAVINGAPKTEGEQNEKS